MISDVLSDAIAQIKIYQAELPAVYDAIRPEIDRTIHEMEVLRIKLDTPPEMS